MRQIDNTANQSHPIETYLIQAAIPPHDVADRVLRSAALTIDDLLERMFGAIAARETDDSDD